MQPKLLLVDDHLLFLEGLQYLLETYGIEVVGKAKNGREAMMKARILKPNIVLMDIRMPESNGLETLKLMKEEIPDIKVIMLTTSEEDEDLFNAIKYGASGYLLKNTDAKQLIEMLNNLERDELPLSPGLASRLLKEFKRSSELVQRSSEKESGIKKNYELTFRQLEVLEMVARGITYKEAGEMLGLSERTVKYHMNRILELLQLDNRAQVISYAAQNCLFKNKKE
jgi:two-component system NarL family response regulator